MAMDENLNIVGYELDELLSKVSEINSMSKFLENEDVDQTLAQVVKLVAKPDIPIKVATPLITKLQAMSFLFKMQARHYMFIGKGEPNAAHKKNIYMSLSEETKELVQALKYTTRNF